MNKIFVKTQNVRNFIGFVENLINKPKNIPKMGLVYGKPGLGKSQTALWLAFKYDGIYLRALNLMTGRWLLEEIVKELDEIPRFLTSDLSGTLANIYMLDFDSAKQNFANKINGYYRRYSDDILILVNSKEELNNLLILAEDELNKLKLELSKQKTICCHFYDNNCEYEPCSFRNTYNGIAEFQYLGFTRNGKIILVRNGTIVPYIKLYLELSCENERKRLYFREKRNFKKNVIEKI